MTLLIRRRLNVTVRAELSTYISVDNQRAKVCSYLLYSRTRTFYISAIEEHMHP